MNIGAFYQSGYKLVACYKASEQFRKIYPHAPVSFYEDGSNILKQVADRFGFAYNQTNINGINSSHCGRPVHNLSSNLEWLKRIYDSCQTTLSNVEWIIHYEDDVWCKRKILNIPKFDIAGANGPLYTTDLYEYLKNKFNVLDNSRGHWSNYGSLQSYGACGGAIFRRDSFIDAYNKINTIDWNHVYALDSRPCEWTDASLSFIFQHAGFKSGVWDEWGCYDSKNIGCWFDKTGWTIPMEEQPDVAFIHGYKHYYNYKNDELSAII